VETGGNNLTACTVTLTDPALNVVHGAGRREQVNAGAENAHRGLDEGLGCGFHGLQRIEVS
jgi:hypothetical protein